MTMCDGSDESEQPHPLTAWFHGSNTVPLHHWAAKVILIVRKFTTAFRCYSFVHLLQRCRGTQVTQSPHMRDKAQSSERQYLSEDFSQNRHWLGAGRRGTSGNRGRFAGLHHTTKLVTTTTNQNPNAIEV
jgi:hypothetical protein